MEINDTVPNEVKAVKTRSYVIISVSVRLFYNNWTHGL